MRLRMKVLHRGITYYGSPGEVIDTKNGSAQGVVDQAIREFAKEAGKLAYLSMELEDGTVALLLSDALRESVFIFETVED